MIKKILLITSIIIFLASLCFSQEKDRSYIISDSVSSACEDNPAFLDGTLDESTDTKQKIFAIFRAGKNETENTNLKRLVYMKKYLEKRKGWSASNVIYARGEKTNNKAEIEFYIGGKLYLVIIAPKNKTPCMDCCGNELDYPQNLIGTKKHSQKRNKKSFSNQ